MAPIPSQFVEAELCAAPKQSDKFQANLQSETTIRISAIAVRMPREQKNRPNSSITNSLKTDLVTSAHDGITIGITNSSFLMLFARLSHLDLKSLFYIC